MRRATVLGIGLLIGSAAVAGCGPEKVLPTKTQVSTEHSVSTPTIPAASEPEAVKLVEQCLKTATDGHPERLQKARVNRQTAQGTMLLDNPEPVKTTRYVQTIWPDRMRVDYEFETGPRKKFLMGFRRPVVWSFNVTETERKEFTPANTQEFAEIVSADAMGTHWLLTLVPLTDKDAIVFDKAAPSGLDYPAESVKVAIKGYPVYTLVFDRGTSLLRMLSYTNIEVGAPVNKQVRVSGYKAFAGLQLPTEIEYRRNTTVVEKWAVSSWDFPEKIEDSTFDRPSEQVKPGK